MLIVSIFPVFFLFPWREKWAPIVLIFILSPRKDSVSNIRFVTQNDVDGGEKERKSENKINEHKYVHRMNYNLSQPHRSILHTVHRLTDENGNRYFPSLFRPSFDSLTTSFVFFLFDLPSLWPLLLLQSHRTKQIAYKIHWDANILAKVKQRKARRRRRKRSRHCT